MIRSLVLATVLLVPAAAFAQDCEACAVLDRESAGFAAIAREQADQWGSQMHNIEPGSGDQRTFQTGAGIDGGLIPGSGYQGPQFNPWAPDPYAVPR